MAACQVLYRLIADDLNNPGFRNHFVLIFNSWIFLAQSSKKIDAVPTCRAGSPDQAASLLLGPTHTVRDRSSTLASTIGPPIPHLQIKIALDHRFF